MQSEGRHRRSSSAQVEMVWAHHEKGHEMAYEWQEQERTAMRDLVQSGKERIRSRISLQFRSSRKTRTRQAVVENACGCRAKRQVSSRLMMNE